MGTLEIVTGVFYPDVNVDLTGTPQADGSVAFTGTRAPGEFPTNDGRVAIVVTRFVIKADSSAGLIGSLEYTKQYAQPGPYSFAATLLSASLEPAAVVASAGAAGTWSGKAVVRACSGYCPSYVIGNSLSIELTLGQTRNAVTGLGRFSVMSCGGCWLPLSGSASPSGVSLSGIRMEAPTSSNADRALQLETLSGSVDAIGRMQGRFTYSATTIVYNSPTPVSYRLECEILWLTREP